MDRQSVALDPAVMSVISDGNRRASRSRVRRRRPRQDPRQQVNLALNPQVVRMIKNVARAEGVSPAGVVNLLVTSALRRYINEEILFGEHTRGSRSPAYDWVVELHGLSELEQELDKFLERGD